MIFNPCLGLGLKNFQIDLTNNSRAKDNSFLSLSNIGYGLALNIGLFHRKILVGKRPSRNIEYRLCMYST